MFPVSLPKMAKLAAALTISAVLSACNMSTRLANIGQEPPLTTIQNPTTDRNYRPVSLPMPTPEPVTRQANSLWRSGARAFFKDQRAQRVGDLLTVNVTISDQAKLNNTTTRTRGSSEDATIPALAGIEGQLSKVFPESVDPSDLVDFGANSSHTGTGTVDRSETLSVKLAALVTQVLPNGNLVISGRQEIRVNYEVRELVVAGVVRPEDITAINTINSEQIAEARIAYGGRGQLSDVQQPRYGQQIYDIIFPF
jgi:flagellar L-ring protein precursor FlgH